MVGEGGSGEIEDFEMRVGGERSGWVEVEWRRVVVETGGGHGRVMEVGGMGD